MDLDRELVESNQPQHLIAGPGQLVETGVDVEHVADDQRVEVDHHDRSLDIFGAHRIDEVERASQADLLGSECYEE